MYLKDRYYGEKLLKDDIEEDLAIVSEITLDDELIYFYDCSPHDEVKDECIKKMNTTNALKRALICSRTLKHFYILIKLLSDKDLYEVFCELQSNVELNDISQEKSSQIVEKINNQEILKNMAIKAKYYPVVSSVLGKITVYGSLLEIKKERPDLKIHILGRMEYVENSVKFILDD